MSRGGGDDFEEDFPNQAAFWWNAAQRALEGKKGRKALMELREALLMLPEKRLVAGAVSTVRLASEVQEMPDERFGRPNWAKTEGTALCAREGAGVCAVGAYLLRKRVLATGETPTQAMAALPSLADSDGNSLNETAQLGQAGGLTYSLAWLLADRNDEIYAECTAEERYERFMAWLDAQIGPHIATGSCGGDRG